MTFQNGITAARTAGQSGRNSEKGDPAFSFAGGDGKLQKRRNIFPEILS